MIYEDLKMNRALPNTTSSPSFNGRGAVMRGPNEASALLLTKTPLVEPRSRTIQEPFDSR